MKKSKGIQRGGSQVLDFSKDQFMLDSSLMPKNRKSSLGNNLMSTNDSLDFKRDHGKPGDRYKDFFGDLELVEKDSESISGEMPSSGKPKDSQLVEKRSIVECHIWLVFTGEFENDNLVINDLLRQVFHTLEMCGAIFLG
ncbi:uncharacterized protein Fot_02235 [Forsythia ovata]|uniref:Uncharacterized protein n=1 Tax=Forsythia ovata TaxID=205694 RepID=A0ABD1X6U5_9LAMI